MKFHFLFTKTKIELVEEEGDSYLEKNIIRIEGRGGAVDRKTQFTFRIKSGGAWNDREKVYLLLYLHQLQQ